METLQRTANRGSISTGYDIDNSLKFEEDNTEMMEQNPSAGGNRKTFTVSLWMKRSEISTSGNYQWIIGAIGTGESAVISIDPSDVLVLDVGLGSTRNRMTTTQVFRDTSAWTHLVWRVDTTQATATDRNRLYVNGVLAPLTTVDGMPSQNFECEYNNDKLINIGHYQAVNNNGFCGYLAEIHSCDGVSNPPTDFGEFDDDSGIWKPKAYAGSYGSQGFYLPLSNSSNLGANSKGNSVDFTLQNITAADQATDTPTNNFCTINPLIPYYGSVSEGATKFIHTSGGSGWESFVATMGAGTSGKWYAEFKFVDSGTDLIVGICPIDDPDLNRGGISFAYYGSNSSLDESVGIYAANGNRYIGGGPSSYANSWSTSDIMSIAVDMDNGKLYFAKNGTWQNSGDPTSGSTGTGALDVRGATKPQSLGGTVYTAGHSALANYGGFTTISISSAESDANGYGTFEYAPPSGYYALCTKNLAEFG